MKPRVLVVEDDPVSRAFFREVLAGLPAVVDVAARCDTALASARDRPHALWLVDAHLPDGGAVALLPRLRGVPGGGDAVALAHTASRETTVHDALLAAGFVEVLAKPLGAASLLAAARRRLRMRVREPRATFARVPAASARVAGPAATGPWDDAAALAALGSAAQVQALRALLAGELPRIVAQVGNALRARDAAAARALLHQLASACAFTGAHRLGDAVRRLHRDPFDVSVAGAFHEEAASVLARGVDL
ncbi:MAG TPA: response regulator [Xanthomonadaceae bacterium]|nr:response regulator [Xanthomonadaceae bacterium]